jgi:hypothetical protein
VRDTGTGLHTRFTAPDHIFGARRFEPIIEAGGDPSVIPMPEVTVDWEETERTYQRLSELYDGILAVETRASPGTGSPSWTSSPSGAAFRTPSRTWWTGRSGCTVGWSA